MQKEELKENLETASQEQKEEAVEKKSHENCNCDGDCGDNCACKEAENNVKEKVEEKEEEKKEESIEKIKEELEDWKQSYLRKQAEFQNFTKRKEKEMEELRKYSSEKIITKFLDSFDNLERAVGAAAESKDFEGLLKGVEMIIGNLKDIFNSEGVEQIKTEGECDPQYHHAVTVENSEEHKDNEIVTVLQKGYMMKGKVIRPAMVSVCKK